MKRLLITGGCGFIGTNFAAYFQERGWRVTVLDNLSRRGTEENLHWLEHTYPAIRFVKADVRHDQDILRKEIATADVIHHLAAQVAVTTSVDNPREDFEINAQGTLNVLEAARAENPEVTLMYASTNKVYGGMEDVVIEEDEHHYRYRDFPQGISEQRGLDFHSPYGCSKGAADQYVHDYARIYGLKTVVFRQSCIYGPRQYGVEDQGWIAWFIIAAILGQPITIYGDGKQVRDVLYIDDLARVWELAGQRIQEVRGHIFNIGGGPKNVLAIRDILPFIEEHLGQRPEPHESNWRPGDQKVFVSDITKAENLLGWKPTIAPAEGVARLFAWAKSNTDAFQRLGLAKKITRKQIVPEISYVKAS